MAGIDPDALKDWREARGFTPVSMAKELGLSLSYYCDIESGRSRLKRRPDLIMQIAEALNIPVVRIQARV